MPIASNLNDNTKSTNNFTLIFTIKVYSSFRFPYVPLAKETKEYNFPTSTSSSITSPLIACLDLLPFAPPAIVDSYLFIYLVFVSFFFHRQTLTLVVIIMILFRSIFISSGPFRYFFPRWPQSTKGFCLDSKASSWQWLFAVES